MRVIDVLARRGFFDLLDARGPTPLPEVAAALGAHEGHLAAAARLLQGLGWASLGTGDPLALTAGAEDRHAIPADIGDLYRLAPFMREYLQDPSAAPALAPWIPHVDVRWGTEDERFATLLDGVLVVPVLLAAHALELFPEGAPGPAFAALPAPRREEVSDLLRALGWATGDAEALRFRELGRHVLERSMVLGVAASYAPMMARLEELLFGDASRARGFDAAGREVHVDRGLNVIASGFQHERFFRDVEQILVEIFDGLPLEEQPTTMADMGCGDGAFLERAYSVIRERTRRGRHLDERPLRLVGGDLSEEALAEARRRLAGLPCLFVQGDLADPEGFVEALRREGIEDTDGVLHIRSFLDHDRTLLTPPERVPEARPLPPDLPVYVDGDGARVPAPRVVQDLVEHLGRWAGAMGRQGLVVMEVHSLPLAQVAANLDRSDSLYFDALQSFSGQMLVPASTFLLAAAEAGLFPRRGYTRRYPRSLGFQRISLCWLEPRPYRVRAACEDDLPALEALERRAREPALRTPAAELRRRVRDVPGHQWVAEKDEEILAAVYSQRLRDPEALREATVEEVAALHDPEGLHLQLLGLVADPGAGVPGIGEALLDLALEWADSLSGVGSVVGVTRCRSFAGQALPMAAYVAARGEDGLPVDPILRMHTSRGAEIQGLVPGYWEADTSNQGAGVRIRYALGGRAAASSGDLPEDAPATDLPARVEECVRHVLGAARAQAFATDRPLMEMGMDSLDLMELRALLETAIGRSLSPTFFFEHPTVDAVTGWARNGRRGAPREPAPTLRRAAPATSDAAFPSRALRDADVALVGVGCRLPGGVGDPEALWSSLREGRDAVREVPPARRAQWELPELAPFFREFPWIRRGGFLEAVDGFDPAFFHMAPREAARTDPQQRLLLELAWEALEDAGLDPHGLRGSRAGVFTGVFSHDYELLQVRSRPRDYFDAYTATGASASVAAGRVSYFLGCEGPAVTVDTACSSSLVAVHLACQSLRSGESDLALASGVNLMLAPDLSIVFAKAGMLAPDGLCKTFDSRADGYVRGEGGVAVVLMRLEDALAQGRPVLAVVRGSAINQDGASNGLTAPSVPAQEAVLRDALRAAEVEAAEVGYVEAHGTGTALGDPVEVEALGRVFGGAREAPLLLGSLKTNLGHLEAAAGLAGLVKVALSLRAGEVPPHLHLDAPSARIPWGDLPVEVPTSARAWPGEGRRLAGVSAFGFSGTNAHVVLEAWEDPAPGGRDEGPCLLPLSARTPAALRQRRLDLAASLRASPGRPLGDVALALGGRARFEHRLAVVADGGGAAEALSVDEDGPGVYRGSAAGPAEVVFLFTGQGSQYPGMARDLYRSAPVFRETLDRCAALVDPHLDRPLLEVLHGEDPAALADTGYTQPALFAVEVALARLVMSWGVEPAAVMGHSVGEYVAAHLAGVFSLEDGLALLAARARGMQALPPGGAMAAVLAGVDAVEPVLAASRGEVSLAAENAPRSTVISGDARAVEAARAALEARGIGCVPLEVSHAFHSALVEPMLGGLEEAARGISLSPPRLPMVSNVTGELAGEEVTEPGYWARHARGAVRFARGLGTLHREGYRTFLELGPRPVLTGLGRSTLDDPEVTFLPTLDPRRPDARGLLEAAAALFVKGAPLDLQALDPTRRRTRVALPAYPFEREPLWVDPRPAEQPTVPPDEAPGSAHPLLGRRQPSPLREVQYRALLSPSRPAYLADHALRGEVVLPGAGTLEMILAAGREHLGSPEVEVRDLALLAPLRLGSDAPEEVFTVVRPGDTAESPGARVEVHRRDGEGSWVEIATARVTPRQGTAPGVVPEEVRARGARDASPEPFYQEVARAGIEYGPSFRVLEALTTSPGEGLGRVRVPAAPDGPRSISGVHPALLDGCLQVALAATRREEGSLYLPAHVDAAWVAADLPAPLRVWARAGEDGGTSRHTSRWDLVLFDDAGAVRGELRGLVLRAVESLEATPRLDPTRISYEIAWEDAGPAGFPPPLRAGDALRGVLDEATLERDRQERLTRQLEGAARTFVRRAFEDLGLPPGKERRMPEEGLLDSLGVAPERRRLADRLLEVLEEAERGTRREGGGVELHGPGGEPAEVPPEVLRASEEGALLARCGPHLADVLRGRADPLSLVFPGGELDPVVRFYREGLAFRGMNRMTGRAVAEALRDRSPGTRRLIELGAGTGATTEHVLAALEQPLDEYLFTDISPRFLGPGVERLGRPPFLRGSTLDIERLPAEQGLPLEGYDAALAANVLHATRDLPATLAHVRHLLRPDGLLFLLEVTRPRAWIDCTFGLLDGWWRFDDAFRTRQPLLSGERWTAALEGAGFEEVTRLEPAGDAWVAPQALMVARRGPRPVRARPPRWWIVEGATPAPPDLEETLQGRGRALRRGSAREVAGALRGRGDDVIEGVVLVADALVAEDDAGPVTNEDALLDLTRALLGSGEGEATPAAVLLTRGAQPAAGDVTEGGLREAPLLGFARSAALEAPHLGFRRVDLDPIRPDGEGAALAAELLCEDPEDEVALRGGRRRVPRLASLGGRTPVTTPRVLVRSGAGDLGALDLLEARPPLANPGPGEVDVEVACSGLNFLDVMDALGVLPFERSAGLGMECAGRVLRVGRGVDHLDPGDRVMVLAPGSLRRLLRIPADLAARAPDGLTDPEVATSPVAYLTAALALEEVAELRQGQRVLIHAGAGGTGMAAIHVARRRGAEVLATASPSKWDAVRALGVRHVFHSRTRDFVQGVREATRGEGVDVVLNSLTGDLLDASFEVLAPGGHLVELGKADPRDPEEVQRRWPGVRDSRCDLWQLCAATPEAIRPRLEQLAAALAAGDLPALPVRGHPVEDAAAAFRTMQRGEHVGKLALGWDAPGTARVSLRADGAYLVTGGLGGLGLLVARWMAARGAGRLVLMGRSGAREEDAALLDEVRALGAEVLPVAGDVADPEDVRRACARAEDGGFPLRGVVHAAGVLADAPLGEMDAARLAAVAAPKVRGAWNLHRETRGRPLDHFVLFASTASAFGSAGQANHAAANAFLDALAHHRRRRGLPGLSLDWGAWAGRGAAAGAVGRRWARARGLTAMHPEEALAALEEAMVSAGSPQRILAGIEWPNFLAGRPASPFLSRVASEAARPTPDAGTSRERTRAELLATPETERRSALSRLVRGEVARVLGIADPSRIPRGRGFFELGMDSLTAVELRNRLQRGLELSLSTTVAFDHPTAAALAAHLQGKLEEAAGERPSPSAPPRDPSPAPEEDLDGLDTEALADLLEAELAHGDGPGALGRESR